MKHTSVRHDEARDALEYVRLQGSERKRLPAGSRRLGRADPDHITTVTVQVRSRARPGELDAAFNRIALQPIGRRKYLSHEQLVKRFGASAKDLDAVEDFASLFVLNVVERNPGNQTLVLRGRVEDFSRAFQVKLYEYSRAGSTFRGRTGFVRIPKHLEHVIIAVSGLDNRPMRHAPRSHAALDSQAVSIPTFTGKDLAERYRFPTAHPGNGRPLDGKGQTVAVIALGGGYLPQDVEDYFQEHDIPRPSVVAVSVDRRLNLPKSPISEVIMDVEVVGAVAPGARQVVYFGSPSAKGLFDAISAAVMDTERRPSVISISWGFPEDDVTSVTDQILNEMSVLFKKAALLGITICVATGDNGSIDLDPDDPAFANNRGKLHVDFPACLEASLACGGTQLVLNGEGKEAAWEEVTWNEGNGWASGGGVSVRIKRPAYQNKARVPPSPENEYGIKKGRGIPDVSGNALNYKILQQGEFKYAKGTSLVAPLWAGLIARLNHAKGRRVGFLNPILYDHLEVCTDITKGDNDIRPRRRPRQYQAGPNWDAATGLGVPNGEAILKVLG
jgi:kumamolisin